jgi:hypothetical protein
MDERIEKAFAVANFMATLSNQRRIILEEFKQQCIYYQNGGTFNLSPELITFTKALLDLGHSEDVQFIDINNFPVLITDVQKFYDEVVDTYFQAVNQYAIKFAEIKSKRKISDIVEL